MPAEVLALWAALLAAAPGAEVPGLELHPPVLVLGGGERVRVVVRTSGGVPRLSASAGTLGPARQVGPGVFEATLEPPLEAHPQLALVTALVPGGVAFAWLPLVGRGVAIARTAPHADVTVKIRDRFFGPARADAEGIARVPVEVPPGERYARHRGKLLDLRVPPLHRAQVLADRTVLRADREETVTVYAFAATPEGAPWGGAPLALSVSAGRLGPTREIAPGALAAEWTLPAGAAGEVGVEARLPDVPPAREEVVRAPGPPAHVALRLGAPRVVAGDPPVGLEVEISDEGGNRVDGEVALRTSFGALSAPVRTAAGFLRASLRVPERLEGRASALVEAALGGTVDRNAVILTPAAAATLSVEVERPELRADGEAASDVSVSLADRFGNGVDEPLPSVETGRGRVGPLVREGPGRYRTRYQPGWSSRGGEDAVIARAGGLEARAPVRLLAPPPVLAATLRGGALHAFGGFTAPYLAAAVEAWPLRLGGRYGFAVGVARAASARDETIATGGTPRTVSASSSRWPVEATALVRLHLGPRLTFESGAGAGAVLVHSAVELGGVRAADEWGFAPSLHATAGAALALPIRRLRVRLDARLAWQDDPGMRSFRGGLRTLALALGLTHDAL